MPRPKSETDGHSTQPPSTPGNAPGAPPPPPAHRPPSPLFLSGAPRAAAEGWAGSSPKEMYQRPTGTWKGANQSRPLHTRLDDQGREPPAGDVGTPGDSLRGAVKRQPLWTAALPRASSSPPLGVRVLERSGNRSPRACTWTFAQQCSQQPNVETARGPPTDARINGGGEGGQSARRRAERDEGLKRMQCPRTWKRHPGRKDRIHMQVSDAGKSAGTGSRGADARSRGSDS